LKKAFFQIKRMVAHQKHSPINLPTQTLASKQPTTQPTNQPTNQPTTNRTSKPHPNPSKDTINKDKRTPSHQANRKEYYAFLLEGPSKDIALALGCVKTLFGGMR